MKTKLVLFTALFALFFIACKKDKFTTTPQVTVKSISPGTVTQGNIVSMRTEFTDDEGDLDSIYLVLKWYAGDVGTKVIDTIRYGFDDYGLPPKTREGDLFVRFTYGILGGSYPIMPLTPVTKDTTSTIGILLIDKAKNRSEYAESDKIRLIKP